MHKYFIFIKLLLLIFVAFAWFHFLCLNAYTLQDLNMMYRCWHFEKLKFIWSTNFEMLIKFCINFVDFSLFAFLCIFIFDFNNYDDNTYHKESNFPHSFARGSLSFYFLTSFKMVKVSTQPRNDTLEKSVLSLVKC